MHKVLIAALVAVITSGAFAVPTEAATNKYWDSGWHVFAMNQVRASTTLIDRTPGQTYVWVAIQKKPGAVKCRAKVSFTRGNRTSSRVFEKYSRTQWRSGVWTLGGSRDRTIGVRITTNGRCTVGVGVK